MASALVCFERQYESQDSPSEEFPETETSSDVWEEASDHTEAAEVEAELAIEEL